MADSRALAAGGLAAAGAVVYCCMQKARRDAKQHERDVATSKQAAKATEIFISVMAAAGASPEAAATAGAAAGAASAADTTFDAMDKNHDGTLSHEEVTRYLDAHPDLRRTFGIDGEGHSVKELFDAWDVDKDGKFSRGEFHSMWAGVSAGATKTKLRARPPESSPPAPGAAPAPEAAAGGEGGSPMVDRLKSALRADAAEFQPGGGAASPPPAAPAAAPLNAAAPAWKPNPAAKEWKPNPSAKEWKPSACPETKAATKAASAAAVAADKAFADIDKNSDGTLSPAEVRKYLETHPGLRKTFGVEDLDMGKLFQQWDKEKDGRLSREEFRALWAGTAAAASVHGLNTGAKAWTPGGAK